MALDTYANLQAAVANWMHRSNLTGDIPDFVTLAEVRIKTLLTARPQTVITALLTIGGVEYTLAPADLLRIRALSIPGVVPTIDYLTPEQFNTQYADLRSGVPVNYSIIGELIYWGPTPDQEYSVSTTYQAKFTALSDLVTSNSLLANNPDIYLWGSLVEAAKFAQNIPLQAQYEADFQAAIAGANLLDWHTGGNMRVRTDVRP